MYCTVPAQLWISGELNILNLELCRYLSLASSIVVLPTLWFLQVPCGQLKPHAYFRQSSAAYVLRLEPRELYVENKDAADTVYACQGRTDDKMPGSEELQS